MDLSAFQDELMSHPLAGVYLSTIECSVCKSIKPEIVKLFTSESEFWFTTVDCEVSPAISGQHLVFNVPTLILFFDGREFTRFSRFIRIADVKSAMSHMRSLYESDDESISTNPKNPKIYK